MAARTHTTADAAGTEALGRALGRALRASGVADATVELRGDLGAGKTVFVQGVAAGLGLAVDQPVVSPTFTIARAYVLAPGALAELHHVDAYRLAGATELEGAGFEDMCGPGRVTCVEWGENVEDALPPDRILVHLAVPAGRALGVSDARAAPREITLTARGPQGRRVLAHLGAPEAVP
jgi:tRNA threonylcarbamoyladenosine biosynthesis protein TsaE